MKISKKDRRVANLCSSFIEFMARPIDIDDGLNEFAKESKVLETEAKEAMGNKCYFKTLKYKMCQSSSDMCYSTKVCGGR